jgi:predicted metal-dependent hydrolase
MTSYSINYGTATIDYEIIYSRRKTLGITIYPDQCVIVRAPQGTPLAEIEAIVQKKGSWIIKKQHAFAEYPPPLPPRRYVSGETHLYLGRHYRLQVIEDKDERVTLTNPLLYLHVRDKKDRQRKQKLLTEWYRQQAKIIFPERLDVVYPRAKRHGIPYPQMKIRLMKSRWGSCSTKGSISLNLRLIQTPKACIDYVILHELAHLKEHNHSRAYYNLLDQLLPDWKDRRQELNHFQVS